MSRTQKVIVLLAGALIAARLFFPTTYWYDEWRLNTTDPARCKAGVPYTFESGERCWIHWRARGLRTPTPPEIPDPPVSWKIPLSALETTNYAVEIASRVAVSILQALAVAVLAGALFLVTRRSY